MTQDDRAETIPSESRVRLSLLGGFQLRAGNATITTLTLEAQRLLALLAVQDRVVSRAAVAGTLWPEASEAHAHASLRSALSRLSDLAHRAVLISNTDLMLAPDLVVDLREARTIAHRLMGDPSLIVPGDLSEHAIRALSADCLPDWYDDWAIAESERWRQLRLHALDELARHLVAAGRYGDASAAALAALQVDPLRESACATLIRVHLAEGNQSEARRAFEQYRTLLMRELGIEPTPALSAMLAESHEP